MKAFIFTSGCKKDLTELAGITRYYGYERTRNLLEADLLIYSGCDNSHRIITRGMQEIAAFGAMKKEGAIYIVTGCITKHIDGKKLRESVPEIDCCTPEIEQISSFLSEITFTPKPNSIDDIREYNIEKYSGFLHIGTGCNNRCTFCKVSSGNYPLKSRTWASLMKELDFYQENGCKIIDVHSLNIAQYGIDICGKSMLVQLLYEIQRRGFKWIYLHCLSPKDVNEEILSAISDIKEIVWVNFELESASNRMLKIMNRGYTIEEYMESISYIQSRDPQKYFFSNILPCFPGQTQEDVDKDIAFIKELGEKFYIRLSPFYLQPNTPSFKMQKLPSNVAEEYKEKYFCAATEHNRCFLPKIGDVLTGYCTTFSEGRYYYFRIPIVTFGHIEVITDRKDIKRGEFYNIKITSGEVTSKGNPFVELIGELI